MTVEEAIGVIDDFVSKVDAGCANLTPDHPNRPHLENLRMLLLQGPRQALLEARSKPERKLFQDAASALQAANNDVAGPIDLEVAGTADAVQRFVNAAMQLASVTSRITLMAALPGEDDPEVL